MSERNLNLDFTIYTLVIALSCLGVSGRGSRIVNGRDADVGEFPYIVSLFADGQPQCGGTIIQENVIVTAAHCTVFPPDSYTVTAGEHDLTKSSGNEQVVQGVRYIVHESYDKPMEMENDIAFLIVDPPLQFNEFVKPVKLPSTSLVHPPKATVAGWGRLLNNGPTPSILQAVDIPFVNNHRCNKIFDGDIADTMVCYGGKDGKDSCQGDSGGPLVCPDGDDKVLCGIVSFGADCATPGFPGVYTDVSKFTKWIRTNLKKVSSGIQSKLMDRPRRRSKSGKSNLRRRGTWNRRLSQRFSYFYDY